MECVVESEGVSAAFGHVIGSVASVSGVCRVSLAVRCIMGGAGYLGECVHFLGVVGILCVGLCLSVCVWLRVWWWW